MSIVLALLRSPRSGAARVLREGRLGVALLLVAAATTLSVLNTLRFASEVAVEEVMFGPGRSPAVDALLASLGRDMTAVVLHLFQSSWTALLAVGAVSPVLVWLLGATAVHAAARLNGLRQPFRPMLVLFGYAVGLTSPIALLAALVAGPHAAGTALPQLAGLLYLGWLGLLAWWGTRTHYGLSGGRALTLLAVALAFFYLAPLTLILLALAAILIAAVVLEYVPAP
ncbi:MAG: YIP1 family protein [Candidatus Limnocylindria bacterium]